MKSPYEVFKSLIIVYPYLFAHSVRLLHALVWFGRSFQIIDMALFLRFLAHSSFKLYHSRIWRVILLLLTHYYLLLYNFHFDGPIQCFGAQYFLVAVVCLAHE